MDNDNKKSDGGKVQNDHQTTAKSIVVEPMQNDHQIIGKSFGNDLAGYVKTDQVAKIIGVTKQTVEYWRKRGWFRADLVDHNGVYYYTAEHVEQLKAVYHPNWTRGGYRSALDGEKNPCLKCSPSWKSNMSIGEAKRTRPKRCTLRIISLISLKPI